MPGGFCFDNCCGTTMCDTQLYAAFCAANRTGVVITVKSGGTTVGTATTDTSVGGGFVVVSIPGSGTYTVSATIAGIPCSADLHLVCGGSPDYGLDIWTVEVWGCTGPLEGATVSVTGFPDQTTDSSGKAYYCLPFILGTGSYPFTITHPKFVTYSDTWSGRTCLGPFSLTPATGYHCGGCNLPLSETLHATDSQLGAVTCTWNGVSLWEGTLTQNFAAYCGCPAKTGVTVRYRWPAGPGDDRIVVATRTVGGSLCAAVGTPNTNFFPVVGGHSGVACNPFQVIDTYDGGNCGTGGGGPGIWQTDDPVTVTLTE